MRRGPARQDRPPRVGAAVLVKALAGVFLIFLSSGAGVAIAGYLMIAPPKPQGPGGLQPAIPNIPDDDTGVVDVPPGGPRTLLILGSDRRAKSSTDSKLGQKPHSDTIVLVRLDPKLHRIAVLSLPRDLAVSIPGDGDGMKINQAYDDGGAALTLKTVKHLFYSATGKEFVVNGVIDVNFRGFQAAVDYVHGVYVDVDRRYYNPEGTGFAAIDINAGYQRLEGADALAYVRYRHGDSDIYRNARQQDFLRQAATQKSVRELNSIGDAKRVLARLERYFRFDKKFLGRRNLAGLLKTAVNLALNHAPVNQIRLKGITEAEDPTVDTRLFVSNEHILDAYNEFMTGEHSVNPAANDLPERTPKRKKSSKKAKKAKAPAGLIDASRAGEDLAALAARKLDFPFYFPGLTTGRSQYVSSTPRVYKLADEDGNKHDAYRIVVSVGEPGEYWGVQGMTWMDPPILADPDRVRELNGRKLLLFYDGNRLRMVGWKTARAAYYVTNTIGHKLTNARLLAIAGSLERARR
jgi:polyisoprenyl-teichoic acid--peptidoglycan teichoic acid transferase